MLVFFEIELVLPVELGSGVAAKLFLLVGEGFLFAVELTLLAGELPLLVMLLREGEVPRVNPDLAGEVPLLLVLLTEGEGDQPVPLRAGELPLADGEAPRANVFELAVDDGVPPLGASNGPLPRLPVLARRPGEDVIVEALVYVGEELFIAEEVFAAVAMVALLAELDLVVDGELDRMGVKSRGEDDFVEVDLGEEEPLELYEVVAGLGLFVEVLNAGRGLLEGVGLGPGRVLLEGLAFRLGATAGSRALEVLCGPRNPQH